MQEEGPALHERLNRQTAELATSLNFYFEQQAVPICVVHFGSLFRFVIGREVKHPELFGYHLISKGIHIWEGGNYFLSTAHSEADIRRVIDAVRGSVADLQSGSFLPRRPDGPGGPAVEINTPPPFIPAGPLPVHPTWRHKQFRPARRHPRRQSSNCARPVHDN
jgi:hypothetical protein